MEAEALKSLGTTDDHLGLGIADAVIRQTSRSADLIVRPTSAVRRYQHDEADALTAARQLNVEAVLEGNVQRADDRLRVSVNLLRVADGVSLWADRFDLRMSDIFAIQDAVAQQVAGSLRVNLDALQPDRLTRRQTTNPVAFEFYLPALLPRRAHRAVVLPGDRPRGRRGTALAAPVSNDAYARFAVQTWKAVLKAAKGDARAAEAEIPALLGRHPVKDPFYHHTAYAVAQIWALGGNAPKAVSWLREAAASGYFPHGLLERDAALDGIRRSPEFSGFMAEGSATLRRLAHEFTSLD